MKKLLLSLSFAVSAFAGELQVSGGLGALLMSNPYYPPVVFSGAVGYKRAANSVYLNGDYSWRQYSTLHLGFERTVLRWGRMDIEGGATHFAPGRTSFSTALGLGVAVELKKVTVTLIPKLNMVGSYTPFMTASIRVTKSYRRNK